MTFQYQNKNNFFLENRFISKFETRKTETSRAQIPSETEKTNSKLERSKNELKEIREKTSQVDKLTERQARVLMRKVAGLHDDLTKLQNKVKNSMDIPLGKKKRIGLKIRRLRTVVRNIEIKTQKLLLRKGVDIYLQDKQYIDKFGLPTKQWLVKFFKLSHKEQQRILDFHSNTASTKKLEDFWDEFGTMDLLRRSEGAKIDFYKLVDSYRKRGVDLYLEGKKYWTHKKGQGIPKPTNLWHKEFNRLNLAQQRFLLQRKVKLTKNGPKPNVINYFWEDFLEHHKSKKDPKHHWGGFIHTWSPV